MTLVAVVMVVALLVLGLFFDIVDFMLSPPSLLFFFWFKKGWSYHGLFEIVNFLLKIGGGGKLAYNIFLS